LSQVFLLIADIGGYTRFMKVHRVNLAHAQYVVAQLLEAVIDAAGSLELAKLEGDAAFFYAKLKKPADLQGHVARVLDIRLAFRAKQQAMEIDRVCNCDSCMQVGNLQLKFIAHEGEVAFQKVKKHVELAGVDVILVHRLLKNPVPVPEYVLMSEPVHAALARPLSDHARSIDHDVESFGLTRAFYVDLSEVPAPPVPVPGPSFWGKFSGWLRMTLRSIPYFLGIKKSCVGFRNLDAIGELPAHVHRDEEPAPSASAG
jgi:hypothetical protein